jgi:hypothetical protein
MNLGRFSLWTAGAIAACALTSGGAWAQEPFPHGDLDQSLATEFQAMQVLSTRLSKAEEVGKLVDILASRDAKGFGVWVDGLDLPVPDKCWWVQDKLERTFSSQKLQEVCRLRPILTWREAWLYFGIVEAHRQAGTLPAIELDGTVPPGPFLDDLRKNGLVDCVWEWKVTSHLQPVLGKPYQFCLQPRP